jgi:hypothetical protein
MIHASYARHMGTHRARVEATLDLIDSLIKRAAPTKNKTSILLRPENEMLIPDIEAVLRGHGYWTSRGVVEVEMGKDARMHERIELIISWEDQDASPETQ